MFGSPIAGVINPPYKFLSNLNDNTAEEMLFNLDEDRTEANDLIKDAAGRDKHKTLADSLRQQLRDFLASAKKSWEGADYGVADYKPYNYWMEMDGWGAIPKDLK